MTKTTNIIGTALVSALLAAAGTMASAKSPNSGGGNGVGPSHTPGVPQGQGAGNSTWTSPPGWSSDGKREGWDSSPTPPGWTNDNGQKNGWDGASNAPGIDKR